MIPERKLFVEAVAAEVAHEIMAPINYFRSLLERSRSGEPLDQEDFDIAGEEITRLEELMATLRRLASHRLERAAVSLAELTSGFDLPAFRELEISIDPAATLRCDRRRLAVALEALAENALAAIGPGGRAGLEWITGQTGPRLCVWDDGPGLELAPAFALSTDPNRAGLGLAVAQRTVRAHGWKLELTRTGQRTVATISVRSEDVLS